MKDSSLNKLGGWCSILLGVSYVLVGATFLLLPAEQRALSPTSAEAFYRSYYGNPTVLTLNYWMFALGAVFALGALPAITEAVRPVKEGWARWTSNLAYLGFAVTAIDNFRLIALQPARALGYLLGDASARAAMEAPTVLAGLDPNGWLAFGAVGFWALVTSFLALRSNLWPKVIPYVGIAVGVLYWLVVASFVFESPGLLQIVAALGGVVAAPVWYIALGLRLRKAAPAM